MATTTDTTALQKGAITPSQAEQTSTKKAVNLMETLLSTPTLPTGTSIAPSLQTIQTGELQVTPGVTGTVVAATPTGQTAPTATAATTPTAGTVTNTTLEWNGSSWSSGGTLAANLATMGGGGSQTAAIAFGNTTQCSLYDGSSWTTTTSMSLGGDSSAGTGTTTSSAGALNFLRRPAPADNRKATEEFTGPAPATVTIDTD